MNCSQLNYYLSKNSEMELVYCSGSRINYPEHNHSSIYTIGIVLDGEIFLESYNSKVSYKTDNVFLILPYETHAIYSGDDGYTMLSVCLKEKYICSYDKGKMNEVFLRLVDILVTKNLVKMNNIQEITKEIDMIYKIVSLNKKMANEYSVIKRKLETEPEEEISIEDLAGNVFISKYHFIKQFKKNVGLTPHKYQIQNRIRKAQRFIQEGKNLTEVAMTTGFYDQSHFVRCFKQIVGITPTEYRKFCIRKI